MRTVIIEPLYESWRDKARELLSQKIHPNELLWTTDRTDLNLFAEIENKMPPTEMPITKISGAFLDLARTVAAHTDPNCWALLYRMLWRQTHGAEKHLLGMATDPDVRQAQRWSKSISRDIHKMHAFVRFRFVGKNSLTTREQFVAWFEPEHRIVRLASSFFQKRFTGMDWSILTPMECAHWDGKKLHFTPGVNRDAAPDEDTLDTLWRTYYRSIFNPARLKTKAMQSEMPKKYWKNLPEAQLISELIAESQPRMKQMLGTENRPVRPPPKNLYLESLQRMNDESTEPSIDE
jgi:uracil-DNA glycosylase